MNATQGEGGIYPVSLDNYTVMHGASLTAPVEMYWQDNVSRAIMNLVFTVHEN
jgi:hypothetical protein